MRLLPAAVVALAARATVLVAATGSTFPDHPVTRPEITAADLLVRDQAIASDAFEGRGPGTRPGEAAAQWLADELKRIGVQPGKGGSYFQDVPVAVIALDNARSKLTFHTPRGELTPASPDEVTYWTPRYVEDVQALHRMADALANGDVWPDWRPDSEFRAAHARLTAAGR